MCWKTLTVTLRGTLIVTLKGTLIVTRLAVQEINRALESATADTSTHREVMEAHAGGKLA